jgi:hypothetical protein
MTLGKRKTVVFFELLVLTYKMIEFHNEMKMVKCKVELIIRTIYMYQYFIKNKIFRNNITLQMCVAKVKVIFFLEKISKFMYIWYVKDDSHLTYRNLFSNNILSLARIW